MSRKNTVSSSQGMPSTTPVTVSSTISDHSLSQPSLSTSQTVQVVPVTGGATTSTEHVSPAASQRVQRKRKRTLSTRTVMSGEQTTGTALVSSASPTLSQRGAVVGLSTEQSSQSSQIGLHNRFQCRKCHEQFDEKRDLGKHLERCFPGLTTLLRTEPPIALSTPLAEPQSEIPSLVTSTSTAVETMGSVAELSSARVSQREGINEDQSIGFRQRFNKKKDRVNAPEKRFPNLAKCLTTPEPVTELPLPTSLPSTFPEAGVKTETAGDDRHDMFDVNVPFTQGALEAGALTMSDDFWAFPSLATGTVPHIDPMRRYINTNTEPMAVPGVLLGEDRMWSGEAITSLPEQGLRQDQQPLLTSTSQACLSDFDNTQQERIEDFWGSGNQQDQTSFQITEERNVILLVQEYCVVESFLRQSALSGNPSSTSETFLQCDICRRYFKRERNLLKHKLTTHIQQIPHKCDFCDRVFESTLLLELHKGICPDNKPFKCDICDRAFLVEDNLINHRRIHNKKEHLLCAPYSDTLQYSSALQIHQKTHSGEQATPRELCQAIWDDHSYETRLSDKKRAGFRQKESEAKEVLTGSAMLNPDTRSFSESAHLSTDSEADVSTPLVSVSNYPFSASVSTRQSVEQQSIVVVDLESVSVDIDAAPSQTNRSVPVTEEPDNEGLDHVYVHNNPELKIRMFPEEDD